MCFSKQSNTIFMITPFWERINISSDIVKHRHKEILGNAPQTITDKKEAIKYLQGVTTYIQELMLHWFQSTNHKEVLKELLLILDSCYLQYLRERKDREQLAQIGIRDNEILDLLNENKNIETNIISAISLWCENGLLYQNATKPIYSNDHSLDPIMYIDMYIYGMASRALSLLMLNKGYNLAGDFYGVEIDPNQSDAIKVLKHHPIIYFNPLILGNQENFRMSPGELLKVDTTPFGKAFAEECGLGFDAFLMLLELFQRKILRKGKKAFVVLPKEKFLKMVSRLSRKNVDLHKFCNAFVLTQGKIQTQLLVNKQGNPEPVIWRMSCNRFRLELCPFVCLEDDSVFISYAAVDQAKHFWYSSFTNGGVMHTNQKDNITKSIDVRDQILSAQLVDMLRSILQKNYKAGFDEVNVDYKRIFGKQDKNYGDYDLVYYAEDVKELFLIEAKFFSDSFNSSGMITDYDKLFKPSGYYDHCRGRCDLVLRHPEKMKDFINVTGEIGVHFLFVSSKPIEIEFTDADGVVSFPCLPIFEPYIQGKLLSVDGTKTIRPVRYI